MKYRFMGRTGLQVSQLCLGAMTFGRESAPEESFQMLDRFASAGGNFIDTADVYGQGVSEEIVGQWLQRQRREDWVIATKVRFRFGDGVNDEGLSRKHILASIEGSLRRLGTDYVDLYQLHGWWEPVNLEETLGTLHSLVQSGKVRYLGVSNFRGWQLQKGIDISRARGWEPFVCLQPLYNLLDRGIEYELIPICQQEGVGVIPWSPLRGGWLTGRYRRGMTAPPAGSRVDAATKQGWSESWDLYDNERTWTIVDTLLAVADELGRSPAQVALRWLLEKPAVTAPIVGARKMSQLEDNLGVLAWQLPAEQLERLDEVSTPQRIYPYW